MGPLTATPADRPATDRRSARRALLTDPAFRAGLAAGAALAAALPLAALGLRAARHRVHLRRAREVLTELAAPAPPSWP